MFFSCLWILRRGVCEIPWPYSMHAHVPLPLCPLFPCMKMCIPPSFLLTLPKSGFAHPSLATGAWSCWALSMPFHCCLHRFSLEWKDTWKTKSSGSINSINNAKIQYLSICRFLYLVQDNFPLCLKLQAEFESSFGISYQMTYSVQAYFIIQPHFIS